MDDSIYSFIPFNIIYFHYILLILIFMFSCKIIKLWCSSHVTTSHGTFYLLKKIICGSTALQGAYLTILWPIVYLIKNTIT